MIVVDVVFVVVAVAIDVVVVVVLVLGRVVATRLVLVQDQGVIGRREWCQSCV